MYAHIMSHNSTTASAHSYRGSCPPTSDAVVPDSSSTINPSSSAMELTPVASQTQTCIKVEIDANNVSVVAVAHPGPTVALCPSSFGSHDSCACESCCSSLDARPNTDVVPLDVAFRSLETLEAQKRFSRRLDQLLQEVIRDSEDQDDSTYHGDNTPVSRVSTSTSSSLYAADISADTSANGSRFVSVTSATFRPSSSTSKSCLHDVSELPRSVSTDSTALQSAPSGIAAQLVYGSISDRSVDLTCGVEDDVGIKTKMSFPQTTSNADKVETPRSTAFPTDPSPPKKTQHYIHPSKAVNKELSTSRKRHRAPSPIDLPEQDHLKPGQCILLSNARTGTVTARSREGYRAAVRQEAHSGLEESAAKKRKLSPQSAGPSKAVAPVVRSKYFAKEPASLRRAASLRSEASKATILDPTTQEITSSAVVKKEADATPDHRSILLGDGSKDLPPGFIPTEPASPATPNTGRPSSPLCPPPILSPSSFASGRRPPLSGIDAAERRLLVLLKKERNERLKDGLPAPTIETPLAPISLNDSEDELWRAVDSQSTPILLDGKTSPRNSVKKSRFSSSDVVKATLSLGIKENFRMKVVDWIIEVIPPKVAAKPTVCANLRSQLTDSPDTRWLAAHIFTRYFLRLGKSPLSSPIPETSKKSSKGTRILTGPEAITWDIAVACISLAVKLLRDFLPPLYPVIANEYLILAPHTMEYDDLEAAHRDVLGAFSHCIVGCTPAAYMEEIFLALPSLWKLIDTHGDREYTSSEVWEILYDSLIDVAYLHYPVYLITGCALIIGITESIVFKQKTDAALKARCGNEPASKRRRATKCECETVLAKARKLTKPAALDIRELLGVSEASWDECMGWLQGLLDV